MDFDTVKMLTRLYGTAMAAFLMWAVLLMAVRSIAATSLIAPLGNEGTRWLSLAIAIPVLLYGYATWRLWRWDSGREPVCRNCGGILVVDLRRPRQRCLRCNRTEAL